MTLVVGVAVFALMREAVRAERERLGPLRRGSWLTRWLHPLALSGWVEVLRLTPDERDEMISAERIAAEIAADIERLERVSRRFELIGQKPALEPVAVTEVISDLDGYLRPRLPSLGSEIRLRARVRPGVSPINGNRVLIVGALKNRGRISRSMCRPRRRFHQDRRRGCGGGMGSSLRCLDTGPGIPLEIRDRIFQPGSRPSSGLGRGARPDPADRRGTPWWEDHEPFSPDGGGTVFEIEPPGVDRAEVVASLGVERATARGVSRPGIE